MNAPRNLGTLAGTTLHPFQWNERWNAERRIASNGAGFRWNDLWNDARIPILERSTHSLRVERWNGGQQQPTKETHHERIHD